MFLSLHPSIETGFWTRDNLPIVVTAYHPKFATKYKEVKFDVDGNHALFEGDIVLATLDAVREANRSGKGVGVNNEKLFWDKGIVPYVIADNELTSRVEAAIAHWQTRTPFRFAQRATENDYISFERRRGCWSQVGRQGGKQVISLDAGCGIGSAIHEIGHALGLWHEQSRSDRDQYIEVIWANIDPQQRHNFDQHVLDGQDLWSYDYSSIMHYPATAFSINGEPTIRTKQNTSIGQRNGLSIGDIESIKLLYKRLDWSNLASRQNADLTEPAA